MGWQHCCKSSAIGYNKPTGSSNTRIRDKRPYSIGKDSRCNSRRINDLFLNIVLLNEGYKLSNELNIKCTSSSRVCKRTWKRAIAINPDKHNKNIHLQRVHDFIASEGRIPH